jgi:hypothetical protein
MTRQFPPPMAVLPLAPAATRTWHIPPALPSLRPPPLILHRMPWEYTPAMQLPPQRLPAIPDPVPDPEPASPSLPEPDPGVFHHEISPPKPPHHPSDQ